MRNEVYDKVKRLPADKQQEVEDFINFLTEKYLGKSESMEAIANKLPEYGSLTWADLYSG